MSILAKIGQTVLKVIGIASGFLPLFQQTYGQSTGTVAQVTDDLTKIAAAVQTVEVVIGAISDPNAKTGPQKLKASVPLIAQVVQQAEFVSGKKLKNESLFIQGCTKVGDGMADILNAFEG